MKRMIALDGGQGEGGGQILRSALSWDRSVWSSGLAPCAAAITALLSVAPEVVRWCCKRCCPRCGLPMDLRVLK